MSRDASQVNNVVPDVSRLDLENPCGRCRYIAWLKEDQRVQNTIDAVAEFGGQTVGLPERLAGLDQNKPPHPPGEHTCGGSA